jgi:acetyltransferase-like isoleucine patch superfamily enzyme
VSGPIQTAPSPYRSLITAGENSYGIASIKIHAWNLNQKLIIGNYCSIGENLQVILGGNHNLQIISTYPFAKLPTKGNLRGDRSTHPLDTGDIIISNDVWVGINCTLLGGVKIGNGAVIAANSHVTKDVKDYEIVGGNPAAHIKFRFENEVILRLLEIAWWDWPLGIVLENVDSIVTKPTLETLDTLTRVARDLSPNDYH